MNIGGSIVLLERKWERGEIKKGWIVTFLSLF